MSQRWSQRPRRVQVVAVAAVRRRLPVRLPVAEVEAAKAVRHLR